MSLAALAQFAVNNNNNRASKTPTYLLPIEEARTVVKIKDGNKKPKLDGSQALTLTLGKIVLALDAVKPGATRINALPEQVEEFTALLQDALDAGEFDDAIIQAQAKADPANKPVASDLVEENVEEEVAPEGVDLDELV